MGERDHRRRLRAGEEDAMKTVIRVVTALALVGLASPALPCPSMQTTQAGVQPVAKDKVKVAKSEKGPKAAPDKDAKAQKPTTAAN